MVIRRAEKRDYISIAQLHRDGIKKGFLSSLGVQFLTRLYEAINNEQGACVLVADEDGAVTGFISGVVDIRGLYKRILSGNWFHFVIPLLGHLVSVSIIKNVVETLFYGLNTKKNKSHPTGCDAELLSVAVNSNYRGQGVGKNLVDGLEVFLKRKYVKEYTVVTFSLDERSNGFYCACNFSFAGTFSHHGNVMNIYHKKLL
jgi:N-acetylglutamate synthase-like GNAT family acetyltransferase